MIKEHTGRSEKLFAKSIFLQNLYVEDKFPDWALGGSKMPHHFLPKDLEKDYLQLVRNQALERTRFLSNHLRDEASYSRRIIASQTAACLLPSEKEVDVATLPVLQDHIAVVTRHRVSKRYEDLEKTIPSISRVGFLTVRNLFLTRRVINPSFTAVFTSY